MFTEMTCGQMKIIVHFSNATCSLIWRKSGKEELCNSWFSSKLWWCKRLT